MSKYSMSLSLNVLNHLGLNLYSNVPAVLAEAVANCWDADAEHVEITFDSEAGEVIIQDDGHGMTENDINERYLHVGYERRKAGEAETPRFKRPVMGRKGIGKLSLFSIAKEIEVQSAKDGEQNGFVMRVEDIRNRIASGKSDYRPEELSSDDISIREGTRITLRGLKKRTSRAASALRKRLARRFSIIGEEHQFEITVDGEPVTVEDRDYFHKIQYLWTYDDHEDIAERCKNATEQEERSGDASGHSVGGWIGTVEKSTDLKEDGRSLNQIVVMMRGKLAQEDVLDLFGEGGVYTRYIIGELHADFLDADSEADIATSSRQSIVEDDPRFQALLQFVRSELKHVESSWTKFRNKSGTKTALENPAIEAWFKELGPDARKRAEKLFGKINQLTIDAREDRDSLFKHAVLAFESLRYKEQLDALDQITTENVETIAPILASLDDIEASLYHQIARERVAVIEALTEKVDEDAREAVIQEHLFKNLWLLDPSWERATATEFMESRVEKEFGAIDAELTDEERAGRVDIKYRTTSGKHVVVELKRAGRVLKETEIVEQVTKYLRAVDKVLDAAGQSGQVEAVVVLGEWPREWDRTQDRERGEKSLAAHRIRVVLYDELIENASKAYADYVAARADVGRLGMLLEAIGESTASDN